MKKQTLELSFGQALSVTERWEIVNEKTSTGNLTFLLEIGHKGYLL